MRADLIFDFGAHRGEDTEFYLKKGFCVVAVEADPELVEGLRQRFSNYLSEKKLTLVGKALAENPGRVTLFKNSEKAIWNTIDIEFDKRNSRSANTQSTAVEVEATNVPALLEEFGTPYFIKVDIEGMDRVAIQGLRTAKERPKYISIESEKVSFLELRRDFELLQDLGFHRFKISPQLKVHQYRQPIPAREGIEAQHVFPHGSSGPFGEELPGRWMTADEAIEAYRPIFLRYALTGDDPYLTSKWTRRLLKRTGFRAGWHDLHARLGA